MGRSPRVRVRARLGNAPVHLEHKRGRWVVACSGGLTAILFATGCTGGAENSPAASPGPTSGSVAAPSTGAGPGGSGSTYNAVGLDLCAVTDIAPLANLSLTVTRKETRQPRSAPGSACQFEMRTRSGHEATLLVEASTPGSVDDAARLYRATRDVSVMRPDGAVPGLGEEAEGFSQESEPGFKYSEYLVHARGGNLVLKVWLAVGGTAFTPKGVLAEQTTAIAKATLGKVPVA